MDFTVTTQNKEKHFALSGQFTFADNVKFRQITEALKEGGINAVVMDFSSVTFIDSAGLGMLLLFRDECQHHKIPVSIHTATGQVEKIFAISKFDQLFSAPASPPAKA